MTIKSIKHLPIAALFLVGSSLALADTVSIGTGQSPTWQTWSTPQLSNTAWGANSTPYWNNSSWDGANQNVGYCLTGSCGMSSAPGVLPYLGQTKGQAVSAFFFNSSGGTVTATLEAQIAGNAAQDSIGWYALSNPSKLNVIFPVSPSSNQVTFNPTGAYGLYFTDTAANDTFLSQSTLGSDPGYQHFAVFQASSSSYFVGAEDLPSSGTDFDYNDMIIKLSSSNASPVPEPAALALMGIGLLGLGTVRFWRKAAAETK